MSAPAPLVTVLMPVYNGERFLDQALASVFAQDFQDIELVAVDDGSTDSSGAILQRWAARDARLVLLPLGRNHGIPGALNHGLALARGTYVTLQDGDDLALPGRIRAQVELLQREPGVVLVGARYDLIDEDGRLIAREGHVAPSSAIAFLLNFSNAVAGHGQLMFRRAEVLALGGYDEDYALSSDYELCTRLLRRGRVVILPLVGMRHRMHGHRVSVVRGGEQRRNSHSIARRMLDAWLGRAQSDAEHEALTAMWRQHGCRGVGRDAERLLAEAYALFMARLPEPEARTRVRRVIALRWFLSMQALLRHGVPGEALRHLAYGLRWSPAGVGYGLLRKLARVTRLLRQVPGRALGRLRRRGRSGRS